MSLLALAEVILTLLALVGVGWVLRATRLLSSADSKPINRIIVYVGLPALVFNAVQPAELSSDLAGIAAIAWAAFLGALALGWFASRGLRLPPPVVGGFLLVAALGNTGYIGYPVALTLLGEEGLVQAIFYDLFGTVAALLLVGLVIAARMGEHEAERVQPLRELLTFPAVIALAAALALRSVPIPDPVSIGLETLANLVVPLIMISVGLSLEPRTIRPQAVPLAIVAAIKLLAAPLIAFAVARATGMDDQAARIVTMQAGMPSMMLSLVIGLRFGLDTDFIASAILVTTAASVLTIPLLQLLLF